MANRRDVMGLPILIHASGCRHDAIRPTHLLQPCRKDTITLAYVQVFSVGCKAQAATVEEILAGPVVAIKVVAYSTTSCD